MWNIYPNENCEVQEIKKCEAYVIGLKILIWQHEAYKIKKCEAYVIRLQILRWQHNSNDTKIRQK